MTDGRAALAPWRERLTVLHGLRLSRIGRAADMPMLHFGVLRSHGSRQGLVGEFALHIQCPWRLDGPHHTLTGQSDLRVFGGAGTTPVDWDYERGGSVHDQVLDDLFGPGSKKLGWLNDGERFVVSSMSPLSTETCGSASRTTMRCESSRTARRPSRGASSRPVPIVTWFTVDRPQWSRVHAEAAMTVIATRLTVSPDGAISVATPLPAGEYAASIEVGDRPDIVDRPARQLPVLPFDVDALPVHDLGPWPEELSLRREDMYGDDGR